MWLKGDLEVYWLSFKDDLAPLLISVLVIPPGKARLN